MFVCADRRGVFDGENPKKGLVGFLRLAVESIVNRQEVFGSACCFVLFFGAPRDLWTLWRESF